MYILFAFLISELFAQEILFKSPDLISFQSSKIVKLKEVCRSSNSSEGQPRYGISLKEVKIKEKTEQYQVNEVLIPGSCNQNLSDIKNLKKNIDRCKEDGKDKSQLYEIRNFSLTKKKGDYFGIQNVHLGKLQILKTIIVN